MLAVRFADRKVPISGADVEWPRLKTPLSPPDHLQTTRRCEKRGVVLESCVQTEDVTNLKGGAVVHHEVAAHNHVYVVWRRRRKHHFQLARARLHLLLQARRQSSIHDQLAL